MNSGKEVDFILLYLLLFNFFCMKNSILIVEDNVDLIEAYKLVFETEGFDVHVAYDGKQALEELKGFQPDVILLDIMIPYMNGFQLLKEVRESGNMVKIVINSNLSQESEIQKSYEMGANAYLRKSDYTVTELVAKVKSFL